MNKRTVSIGGATYDIFIEFNSDTLKRHENNGNFCLKPGEKIKTENVTESCGGGASNTSVGLARLGCNAMFNGVVGNDQWGEILLKNFKKEGVDTSAITVVENEVSSFSIILVQANGERIIIYDPGTNAHLHDSNFAKESICSADWIYLNHIQKRSCVIENDIVDILCKNTSTNLTWNPGGCQIDEGYKSKHNEILLNKTTLLQLNEQEAIKFTEEATAEDAIRALLKSGATNICITNGGKGSIGSDGTNIYKCPALQIDKICDTTGAGDAFGTGATWALINDKDLPTALKAGSINAANVVRKIGAQGGLLTETNMESKLKEVSLNVESQTL
ncbi:MAG: carbohydrate kinase family protein [Candidatus Peribacteraceae bacterium]|nr:carbohydrate kinase family protein [Candidatus Peribacteraceae bacterium]